MEILSSYGVEIPLLSTWGNIYKMNQKIECRTFTGNQRTKSNKKFVYVTKKGTVYHTDIECTYLVIKKEKVDYKDIDDMRNTSGAKYEKCKECFDKNNTNNEIDKVYITSYGTSYHRYITCSTINRTILPIEVVDIKGRKKCEKCIGGKR